LPAIALGPERQHCPDGQRTWSGHIQRASSDGDPRQIARKHRLDLGFKDAAFTRGVVQRKGLHPFEGNGHHCRDVHQVRSRKEAGFRFEGSSP
jgi:hypothetical protein